MSSHPPSPDDLAAGISSSSELRRSVSQATDRIHEIIDAAERVALEIRSDAEREAERYLAERKRAADELAEARIREAERAAAGRSSALDEVIETLATSAERFKSQAEEMLAGLDRAIAEARARVYTNAVAEPAREKPAIAPLREVEPEPAVRPKAAAASSPDAGGDQADREPQAAADQTSEAVLRATQMAVIGKGRVEIAKSLAIDFPAVDADAILNEILE